ncbi:hypothetical protein J4218_04880 [Candidatus Pacearchaeota archaeon]|nr:hypothetical protein [Candidatus Pacearchaeota archaeon]
MKKDELEEYFIMIAEIILIILFITLFYWRYYFFGIVCFIGMIIIWLLETKKAGLTVFWALVISGVVLVLILNNFLFGIVIIFFGIGERFANSGFRGDH